MDLDSFALFSLTLEGGKSASYEDISRQDAIPSHETHGLLHHATTLRLTVTQAHTLLHTTRVLQFVVFPDLEVRLGMLSEAGDSVGDNTEEFKWPLFWIESFEELHRVI